MDIRPENDKRGVIDWVSPGDSEFCAAVGNAVANCDRRSGA